ncbi:MAG TPA: EAL domain-containing protein [Burkholderiaceae bacterium]|nr:EAL domain-containing protein [Burkholderiaceae bacterium]
MSWWRDQFEIYGALDQTSAEIRGRHLAALTRLTPVVMLANAFNGALVGVVFWNSVPRASLMLWLAALGAALASAVLAWIRRRNAPARAASPRAIRRATVHAAVLALIWGMVPAAWFASSGPGQRLLVAVLTCGMMCAGAFALATVPSASLVYVAILTAAAAYALAVSHEPLFAYVGALLFVYAFVIVAAALSAARQFTARLVSEREAARQGQMVALLLRDFEEHAADVLWEIGRDGRITHVSSKLAAMLGHSAEALRASHLVDLLEERRPPSASRDAFATLRAALAGDRPFREIVVPIDADHGARWWSITAKPVLEEYGRHNGWRGVISDVTRERRAHQRLEHLAHYDSLTGLANRVRLRERLARFVGSAGSSAHRGALMLVDLDRFKEINDTYGHSTGDAVLQTVASRLQSVVRDRDLLARMGGDEFAIVLGDVAGADEVSAVARRLLRGLAAPCVAQGCNVDLGASIGIALLPEHGASVDEALGNADLALYAVKDGGRGRFAFFVPKLGDRQRRRRAIERELREALARGEITLHWQAQIDVATWSPASAEALLRWRSPTLGAVAPAEFIPIAEESGLMVEIGGWVLAQACREAALHLGGLGASVNASAVQLARSDFPASVERALKSSGLAAQRLQIEIAESSLHDGAPTTLDNLQRLKRLGVRVALDNFGTGGSALAGLLHYPIDALKIDSRFMQDLTKRGDARAAIRAVVALAESIGVITVAGGVEETSQFEILRDAGCRRIQGHIAARPVAIADLQAMLATWRAGVPPQAVTPQAAVPPIVTPRTAATPG